MIQKAKQFYILTKPGIIRGNVIHTLAGALFASIWVPNWLLIIGVLIGTSFVIASACVVNNYLDRNIDRKMKRTSKRASATREISVKHGMIFAAVLLAIGFATLLAFTNIYVVIIGIIAYVMYSFVYTLSKPRTIHSTLIGTIPGALPAMAGYVAVVGEVTLGAWLVFLLIAAWQMPHFYAISIFRRDEYKAAGVPVLGVVKPFEVVKSHILFYQLLYTCAVTALIYTETVSPPAGVILLAGAAYWLGVYAFTKGDKIKWAKSVFGASLVLTLLLPVIAIIHMVSNSI